MIERGSGRAMVTDFGIARARSGPGVTDRLTLEGQLLGTASFMSPEQGAGEAVDGRSDLYSLGSVGFYALTGRAPFEATTLEAILVARFTRAAPAVASIRPDIPSALAATIDRCLAREPHDRFASGEAVADALSEGTGIAGTQEVAPPVRSFLRAAEQTLWLASLIIIFTILYGVPAGRRLGPLLVGIVLGIVIVSIDLFRRARELLGEGFDAADVRRGFAIEKQAHAEEMRRLFDARRTAARRRLGRRAWGVFLIGVVARVLTQIALNSAPRSQWKWLIPAMVAADISNTVSLVIGLNASPRAERRMFRLAAWMWQSRFARAFFWVAGIGRARPEKRGRAPNADTPSYRLIDLAPAAVKATYPDLPDLLKRLDATQSGLRQREADVARALTESGGGRVSATRLDGDGSRERSSGGFTTPSELALEDRRVALLDEMRDALQTTRARRTTIAAALENVRIQLLRVGAGVGSADDMREEVAALQRLAES
jgi:serine/threonine-protein kinase